MLTQFEYEEHYFPCPSFSELPAPEAYAFFQSDTTYLQQLKIRDSLDIMSRTKIDSLIMAPVIGIDSIAIDTVLQKELVLPQSR